MKIPPVIPFIITSVSLGFVIFFLTKAVHYILAK